MTSVYVVTSGEYSDYHIEAIFSTQEYAEMYQISQGINSYNGNPIEKYELDDKLSSISEKVKQGYKYYYIEIRLDSGLIEEIYISNPEEYEDEPDFHYEGFVKIDIQTDDRVTTQSGPLEIYTYKILCVYCWAKSEKDAAKIAAEKRAQWLDNHTAKIAAEKRSQWINDHEKEWIDLLR